MLLSDEEFEALSPEDQDRYLDLLAQEADVWTLSPKQQEAERLVEECDEFLYGGAAGGGKSEWLLYHADRLSREVPGHASLILRQSFPELRRSLIRRSFTRLLYDDSRCEHPVWRAADKEWRYPNGSVIELGYCDTDESVGQYLSAEYDFIGFDEMTEFTQYQWDMLRSRARTTIAKKKHGARPHVAGATNPGRRGHCLPHGDVLTPSGWTPIQDIRVGDPVFTVRPDRTLAESVVEQTHTEWYEGDMVEVRANGLRMSCTPNHKVAKLGGQRGASRGSEFTLVPFEDLPGQATVVRQVEWVGNAPGPFSPPAVPTRKRKVAQPATVEPSAFFRLLGWFLSEGWTLDRDKAFGIAQMKERGRAEIEALLRECGFTFSTSPTGFTCYATDWWAYFRQFGKSREKFIPTWVKAADRYHLRLLFDALMAGDGNWQTPGRAGTYTSISKRLADDVAEVALKIGYKVLVFSRQRDDRDGPHYEVRVSRSKRPGTEILTGQHVYSVETETQRRSDVQHVPFAGPVYCIGVPDTHSFVVRQHGSVWVSGNSWVKELFVKGTDYGSFIRREEMRMPTGEVAVRRIGFLPATVMDNSHIDPKYVENLMTLPENLRRQYLEGDWDSFEGQYFPEFAKSKTLADGSNVPWHVVEPFEVPHEWPRFRAIDYGYAAPFACLWFTVDQDGHVFIYREAYQSGLTPLEQADLVNRLSVCTANGITKPEKIDYTVADPSMWSHRGDMTLAAQYAKGGVRLRRGENDRLAGWARCRDWLRAAEAPEGVIPRPGIQFFSSCTNLIRTFPELIHDKNKPEDLDTTGDDHLADALRYGLMTRPPKFKPTVEPDTSLQARIWQTIDRMSNRRRIHPELGKL